MVQENAQESGYRISPRKFDYKIAHANGFCHEWLIDTKATLVEKVDRFFGGWPVEYNALLFYHGMGEGSRVMEFGANGGVGFNRDWWTPVLTDIEYYRIKAGGLPPVDAHRFADKLRCVAAELEAVK